MVTPKPINYTIFCKDSTRCFRSTWIFCSNCDWFFAIISRKYKKWAIFDILMTLILGVNMITRQMTSFFHLLFELYPLVYILFLHFNTFKVMWNTHLHAKYDAFKLVSININKRKICQPLVYNMFFSPFDTNLASIPWTI